MKKPHLVACPSCARHLRVNEAACPFCGAVLPDSVRESAPPQPPAVRLTRAALFAFGTGTLALAPGCSSSSPSPDAGLVYAPPYGIAPPFPDGGTDDGGLGVGIAAYGGSGVTPDSDGGASDATVGDGSADGGPGIDFDSAVGPDAPAAQDGAAPQDTSDDHVSATPLYGISPH
jgi:hypothetical protein